MKQSIIFLLVLAAFIYSQPKDEFKPEIKVGATIFTGWEFNIDKAEFISKLDTNSPDANVPFGYLPVKNQFEVSKNSFFLERAYINVIASLTPDLKARVTPDVFSFTDGSGKTQYEIGIKFAFFDYTPFKNDNGMSLGFTLGLVNNNWVTNAEKYWGYRGLAKTFTDYTFTTSAVRSGNSVLRTTGSYFPTADLGLQINFMAPKGIAELQAAVVNGNGFRNLSFDNRFKDVFLSGFVHPLQPSIVKSTVAEPRKGGIMDLTFGGYAYIGKLDKGENYSTGGAQFKRNRFGAMAHLRYNFKKAGFFRIGGEYSVQSNVDPGTGISPVGTEVETSAKGFSAYLEFNPPVVSINEKLMLVLRYDNFDPDIPTPQNTVLQHVEFNGSNAKQQLLIGALAFKPNKLLTLAASYQNIIYEDNFVVKYDGTTTTSDSKFIVHGILNF